jgi:molybdopterin-guanine dinucleotide biosynthesis protein A
MARRRDVAPFGLILAGGEGRRMGGADKALLPFGAACLLDQCLDRFSPQVAELALSANGDGARFARFGLTVLADAPPSRGPLSGVLAGMIRAAAAGAQDLATVPVDAPFLPQDLVPRLLLAGQSAPGAPVIARTPRGPHPTFALWPVALAPALAGFLASPANPRLRDFAESQGAAFADFGDEAEFANLNTPDDLARAARDAL